MPSRQPSAQTVISIKPKNRLSSAYNALDLTYRSPSVEYHQDLLQWAHLLSAMHITNAMLIWGVDINGRDVTV